MGAAPVAKARDHLGEVDKRPMSLAFWNAAT
jgi:hypothetical protein